jgi:DNA-directed RNA polymerase alpha subunit
MFGWLFGDNDDKKNGEKKCIKLHIHYGVVPNGKKLLEKIQEELKNYSIRTLKEKPHFFYQKFPEIRTLNVLDYGKRIDNPQAYEYERRSSFEDLPETFYDCSIRKEIIWSHTAIEIYLEKGRARIVGTLAVRRKRKAICFGDRGGKQPQPVTNFFKPIFSLENMEREVEEKNLMDKKREYDKAKMNYTSGIIVKNKGIIEKNEEWVYARCSDCRAY